MSLEKALDKAIREENARFLADPDAQREAREQGERMREEMERDDALKRALRGRDEPAPIGYRLWVNEARTTLVRMWDDGSVEVATRDHPRDTWGPPIWMAEEKVVRA